MERRGCYFKVHCIIFCRASTALRLKFEVCKELRNHLELLPKTGYIQAQSQFSAQLKFLPRLAWTTTALWKPALHHMSVCQLKGNIEMYISCQLISGKACLKKLATISTKRPACSKHLWLSEWLTRSVRWSDFVVNSFQQCICQSSARFREGGGNVVNSIRLHLSLYICSGRCGLYSARALWPIKSVSVSN